MGKLIDADVLMTWFNDNYDDEDVSVGYVSRIIGEQPEAVVRCKDCKHVERARSEEAARKFGQIYICGQHVFLNPKTNDYCSYAERRTDEKTD